MNVKCLTRQVSLGLLLTLSCMKSCVLSAQDNKPDWQKHIDWSASNADAGGSVDCPNQYISNGVGYLIAAGGRAGAINAALFKAYKNDFDGAFTLVLITQCHNPDAQDAINNAGEKAVLTYLLQNYQGEGLDPDQVTAAVGIALQALTAQ